MSLIDNEAFLLVFYTLRNCGTIKPKRPPLIAIAYCIQIRFLNRYHGNRSQYYFCFFPKENEIRRGKKLRKEGIKNGIKEERGKKRYSGGGNSTECLLCFENWVMVPLRETVPHAQRINALQIMERAAAVVVVKEILR
ncbi:hypothetical protein CEXT_460471 [Caerostris extrusa]|uniref:Uncharacterized protein n=1 Tax=Caerostris extrusa TaxID=172846 RepID=A0AAV4QD96_CAEEX|nr:hypothetical protein CEXT_460471 [Caerostris extrusa]